MEQRSKRRDARQAAPQQRRLKQRSGWGSTRANKHRSADHSLNLSQVRCREGRPFHGHFGPMYFAFASTPVIGCVRVLSRPQVRPESRQRLG